LADDDGEILDASIVLTVSPDFKVKEEVSITKRLLSYQALDTDGDPRTPYCGDLQTLTVTKARVTTPSGKVVDSTPNALNLSTPDTLVAHPSLSGWQEMVVTFLGLEPGAQTELSYIREDKTAFRTTFEKKQVLAWHFPLRKGTVTVRLPKGMPLTYQMMNVKGEAAFNAGSDLTEYVFTFRDLPAFSDRDMHNGEAHLPTLYLTTTPSWQAVGKRLQAIAEQYGAPDEAITKKARELTKDAMTDLDKAVAIHHFVKERFREVEWPLQDSLLLFNDAGKTFAAGQGTNLELALLLRALLRAAQVSAEMALSAPRPFPDQAPGLSSFDRALVGGQGDLNIFMDPTGDPGPEPAGRSCLGAGADTPLHYPLEGKAMITGTIHLQEGKLSGSARLALIGSFNPYWENLEGTDVLKSAVKPWLPFPKLKINSLEPRRVDAAATRLEVGFEAEWEKDQRSIRLLPEAKVLVPHVDPRGPASALPFHVPGVEASITWNLEGATGPFPAEWSANGGGGLQTVTWEAQGEATMKAKFIVHEEELPSDRYPSLQAALAAWQNPVVAGVRVPGP
jgi:hypothetical protein